MPGCCAPHHNRELPPILPDCRRPMTYSECSRMKSPDSDEIQPVRKRAPPQLATDASPRHTRHTRHTRHATPTPTPTPTSREKGEMFPTRVLPRLPVHVTFFTRASCGLCEAAREVLAAAWQQRPFEYTEVDVMAAAATARRWRDAYEFDVPVVHIVPARAVAPRAQDGRGDGVVADVHGTGTHGERRKLMHRFTVDQVVGVLREVQELAEKGAGGA